MINNIVVAVLTRPQYIYGVKNMYKKTEQLFIAAILIAGITLFIGCTEKKEANIAENVNFDLKKLTRGLMNLADNEISTSTGYYNIYENGSGGNILYTDYKSKVTMFLCNQPSCTHGDDSCKSYLDTTGQLFLGYEGDKIYLLSNNYSGIGGYPHTLYQMEMNGENRKKIYTFESHENYSGNHIFASKENIYIPVNSGKEKAKILLAIDINTGKSNQLISFEGGETVMGCFENYIYITKPKEFKIDATDNSGGYSIYGYSVADESYTNMLNIDEPTAENIPPSEILFASQDFIILDNYIYIYDYYNAKLSRANISTKEKEEIVTMPQEFKGVSSMYWKAYNSGVLVLNYAADERVFIIDIPNKSVTESTLTTLGSKGNKAQRPLYPQVINEDIVLFYNGSIPFQFKEFFEDGTVVINNSSFGLLNIISREDYLNNIRNYQEIENIEVQNAITSPQ